MFFTIRFTFKISKSTTNMVVFHWCRSSHILLCYECQFTKI